MKNKVMRTHMQERLGKVVNYMLEPPVPASLNIELNNTCNQKCIFCPYHGKYAPERLEPAVLDVDFVKSLLKQAKEVGIGEKEVGFYLAGEPFIYPKLAEVIAYAKELGFKYIFLTTNGAFATPEKMREVLEAGLDSIRFSVNAPNRELYKELHGTDDFNVVCDNIKYLHQYIQEKQNNIAVSLSCVITKKTRGIQAQMREIFSPYVDDIMFIPVILSRLNNLEELKELYEMQDDENAVINTDYICPVLFNSMYINALGQTVPCCNSYDMKVSFTNLKENDNLLKAWHSEEYAKYRKIFLENASDEGTLCATCIMRKKGVQRLSME